MKEATRGKRMKTKTGTNSFSLNRGSSAKGQLLTAPRERPGQGTGLELKARQARQSYTKQGEIHVGTSLRSCCFAKPFMDVPKAQDPTSPLPAQQFHRDLEILCVSKHLCRGAHLPESHSAVGEEPPTAGTHTPGDGSAMDMAIPTRKAQQGCAPGRSHPPLCKESPLG